MSNIGSVGGPSGIIPPSGPIRPSDVTKTLDSMAQQPYAEMSSHPNLAQANHIAPALKTAVDWAYFNHVQGG